MTLSTDIDIEGPSIREMREAATLAQSLLEKSGWTGIDISFLERIAAQKNDDPDSLRVLQNMADIREREENLSKPKK